MKQAKGIKTEIDYFKFISGLKLCHSVETSNAFLTKNLFELGFKKFFFGCFDPTVKNWIVTSPAFPIYTVNEEWMKLYNLNNWLTNDPVAHNIFNTKCPAIWSQSLVIPEANNIQRKMLSVSKDFGINYGLTVPSFGKPTECAGLAIQVSSKKEEKELVKGYVKDLYFMLSWFYQSTYCFNRKTPTTLLTNRQKECLEWAKEGYTSNQISKILGIREDTVNKHFRDICSRLGVDSRLQAIITAMRIGIISI